MWIKGFMRKEARNQDSMTKRLRDIEDTVNGTFYTSKGLLIGNPTYRHKMRRRPYSNPALRHYRPDQEAGYLQSPSN